MRHHHEDHHHRDIEGGLARATMFGINDGLVSNLALLIAVATATTNQNYIILTGISGLLAGAISMASGEWISVKAQNELTQRELEIERKSIENNPQLEQKELADLYEKRGIEKTQAEQIAKDIHTNIEIALDVHAREELGINIANLDETFGQPEKAAISSFLSFTLGAALPIIPFTLQTGQTAIITAIITGILTSTAIGATLAKYTERTYMKTIIRQIAVVTFACAATYLLGTLIGVNIT